MPNPIQSATEIQHRAARPDCSVALRASAGAGKTKVLVDRFLRLCIEDGPGRAHPRAVLAITFTRKAAVEIQERLLDRARELALADDDRLAAELTELFHGRDNPAPSPGETAAAANLLEQVLEDVSGLNVGTIHSFCQLILGRFAAEAGLDPHFSVLENQDDLIDEAIESLEREMTSDPVLQAAAATVGGNPASVRAALRGILPEQMRLGRWLAAHPPRTAVRLEKLPLLLADLRAFLFPDLAPTDDPAPANFLSLLTDELAAFAGPGADAIAAEMGADLATVKPQNLAKLREEAARVAADLSALQAVAPVDEAAFADLVAAAKKIFLTGANKTRAFTAIRKDVELKERFNALVCEQALGVLGVLHRLGYIELYRHNRDLLHLALRLLDLYDGLKKRDRVVDFQDLEDMACRLMGDPGRVGALLFRLDDSLSHILLDEFQDTNFNQWDMLRPFVDEFLSTDSDGRSRTVFFVGDVKQSIYGFRGAEPDIFSHACALLQSHGLPVESLPTNFRSLEHVVAGVGCLFNVPPLADALSVDERQHARQAWARDEAVGEVLVLAPFAPPTPEQAAVGELTGEAADERSGDQLAARAAAQLVRGMKDDPHEITWDGFGAGRTERPLRWDDFLVLTRSRTEISLYEKAFRDEAIPFVPPGRGMLAASREVQDILALLRWLLWPEDDAALATVLRSPLFRLGEADFQRLLGARGLFRPGEEEGRFRTPSNLWPTLKKLADDPAFARAVRLLAGWRKHLGFATCHDLLRRICREGNALERYRIARGEQARYNLLRLFDVALGPEIAGTPTVRKLVDFLNAAAGRGSQEEGALPRSAGEGRVRFMTVHGAKGLEAPVVLLVDADRPAGAERARVRLQSGSPDTPLLFKVNKAYRDGFTLAPEVNWPEDPLQRASREARERDRTEEANLLYVAMTRARDRLVILGGDRGKGDEFDSPLRQILRGLALDDCAPHFRTDDPPGLTRPPAAAPPRAAAAPTGPEDDTRLWQPPPLRETMKVVTPSGVPAADEDESVVLTAGPRPSSDEGDPTERGQVVHLLLQLAADQGVLPPAVSVHHAEAAAVFAAPELAWVFRPQEVLGQGLSEVPIIHRRPAAGPAGIEERVIGVIDRLVVRPDRVDIVDYKTNRFGGDPAVRANLVHHYQPQLARYREAVAQIYPDRPIHTWLLFTEPGLAGPERLAAVEAS
jgi:ATP-dependent helicase/nuclease subunit A